MKRILTKMKQFFCYHDSKLKASIRKESVSTGSKGKRLTYSITIVKKCKKCGKILDEVIYKENLTYREMRSEMFHIRSYNIEWYYSYPKIRKNRELWYKWEEEYS